MYCFNVLILLENFENHDPLVYNNCYSNPPTNFFLLDSFKKLDNTQPLVSNHPYSYINHLSSTYSSVVQIYMKIMTLTTARQYAETNKLLGQNINS